MDRIERAWRALSLHDVLEARDAYHVHLINQPNVVATAIGRYLQRREDRDPPSAAEKLAKKPGTADARTLDNVEVSVDAWPCVLVFVNHWMDAEEIHDRPDSMVPRRLYLPDGRVVPTCVIYVPEPDSTPRLDQHLSFPTSQTLGGGYVCLCEVQGQERAASIGCLVTDGDKLYALTNRHVTGSDPGRKLFTMVNGSRVPIGVSAGRSVGRRPFDDVYAGLPGGRRTEIAIDAGLIELEDAPRWTSQVFGLGTLGEVVDVGPESLSLDLIGEPVRAFGAASGPLTGRILALQYRFQTQAGVEYMADALIGPRPGEQVANDTRPGDSGTLWVAEAERDDPRGKEGLRPVALEWGGRVFAGGDARNVTPYPLVTFVSNACRALDVDVVVDANVGFERYWGALGHYTIGAKACELVEPADLQAFFMANQHNIGFELATIESGAFLQKQAEFFPLADVPDRVWKKFDKDMVRPHEKPNHFADMDQPNAALGGKTLLGMFEDDKASVDPAVWLDFYEKLAPPTTPNHMGLVPFRVAELYKVAVEALKGSTPDVASGLCALGVMAHYVGDACQPLHASMLHDGATEADKGVHAAYEDDMLDTNRPEMIEALGKALADVKPKPHVKGHRAAGLAVVELMHETFERLPPMTILEVYRKVHTQPHRSEAMWSALGEKTVECIAEGCRTLAMLWSSAWKEAGAAAPAAEEVKPEELSKRYLDRTFAPSMYLPEFVAAGIW